MATPPSCQFFDEGKTRCKTVMGKREWQMWLANGGYQDIMRQTMHIFNDLEAMRTIGLIPGMAYEMVDPTLAEQDGDLAELFLKLCMAVLHFPAVDHDLVISDCKRNGVIINAPSPPALQLHVQGKS